MIPVAAQQTLTGRISKLRSAVQTEPDRPELQLHLGVALQESGDLEGAVHSYQRALALDPRSHEAYNSLGVLFASLDDRDTALVFFEAALALQPGAAEIHSNIANIYLERDQTREAVESYRRAALLRPDAPSYHNHLGNALRLEERYDEAEASMRRALEVRPDYAEAYVNLGMLCIDREQLEQAEQYHRRAIELKPDLAQAHVNLAQLLLGRADFAAGWREQEWRWRWKAFPSPKRNFSQPLWKGEPIAGKRILLHAEQGFGDAIQFLRYVPLVAELDAEIVLEVHPELKSLAESSLSVSKLIARGDPVPQFDWHCPLLSLPLAFATDLGSIPADVPYLRAPRHAPCWLHKEREQDLHVGLVWAGNPKNVRDRKRSLSVAALEPLFQVAGVSFYSLQRGPASTDAASLPFAGVDPQTGDFAATAAAIEQLDLVVSVDTAVAHLAGALGKPVWILLPALAEWRWLRDREDSPWYRTARLFRQQQAGQWGSVIDAVAAQLALRSADRSLGR